METYSFINYKPHLYTKIWTHNFFVHHVSWKAMQSKLTFKWKHMHKALSLKKKHVKWHTFAANLGRDKTLSKTNSTKTENIQEQHQPVHVAQHHNKYFVSFCSILRRPKVVSHFFSQFSLSILMNSSKVSHLPWPFGIV